MPLPKVIAFHGWLGSQRDWRGIFPPSVDLETPNLCSLDLQKLETRLQVEPAYLVGYSMGGRVALHLWQRLRGRLPGLILISARLRGEDLEKRGREEARWGRWLRDSPHSFFEYWDQLAIFKGSQPPCRKRAYRKGFRRRQLYLLKTWPLRRTHLYTPLVEPQKVHLVCGAWEPALVRAYQEEKGARTHIVEGASHRLLRDKPDACRDLFGSILLR